MENTLSLITNINNSLVDVLSNKKNKAYSINSNFSNSDTANKKISNGIFNLKILNGWYILINCIFFVVAENQMKNLLDLYEQMHNDITVMFQKQEKKMGQIQAQIKVIAERLENTGDGKKKSESWWEVCMFVICV